MARIAGIDLPKNKRGEIGLTYIYGIGRSKAKKILNEAGVDGGIPQSSPEDYYRTVLGPGCIMVPGWTFSKGDQQAIKQG